MTQKFDLKQALDILSDKEFEASVPQIFFSCENGAGVYIKGATDSLWYATSAERANLLVAILNDWSRLRKGDSKIMKYGDNRLKRITRFLYKWLWCS